MPKDDNAKREIIKNVKSVIEYKNAARELARKTILEVAPVGENDEENEFLTMSK